MLSDDYRQQVMKELIDFCETEIEVEIGVISADKLLDHFLQSIGVNLYNKGVSDAMDFLKNRLDDIEADMDSLLKR